MGLRGLYAILTKLLSQQPLPPLRMGSLDALRTSVSSILSYCCPNSSVRCRAIIVDCGMLNYDFCPRHALCGGEHSLYAQRIQAFLTCLVEEFLLPDGKVYVVRDSPSANFGPKFACWIKRKRERRRDGLRVVNQNAPQTTRPGHHCTHRVLSHVCRTFGNGSGSGVVEVYASLGEADEGLVFLADREAREDSESPIVILSNDTDPLIHRGLLLDYPNVHCFMCKINQATIWSRHSLVFSKISSLSFFRKEIFPRILEDSDLSVVLPESVRSAMEVASKGHRSCFQGRTGAEQLSSLLEVVVGILGEDLKEEEVRIIRQAVATYFVGLSEEEMLDMVLVQAIECQGRSRQGFLSSVEGEVVRQDDWEGEEEGNLRVLPSSDPLFPSQDEFLELALRVVDSYRSGEICTPSSFILSSRVYRTDFTEVSRLPYFFEDWDRRSVVVLLKRFGWDKSTFVQYDFVGLFDAAVSEESEDDELSVLVPNSESFHLTKIWSFLSSEESEAFDDVSSLEYIMLGGSSSVKNLVLLRAEPTFQNLALVFCEWLAHQASVMSICGDDFSSLFSEFAEGFLCSIETYPIPHQSVSLRRLGEDFDAHSKSFFRGISLFTTFCRVFCDACEICGVSRLRDFVAEVLMSFSGYDMLALFKKKYLSIVNFDGPGLRAFLEEDGEIDQDLPEPAPAPDHLHPRQTLPIHALRREILSSIQSNPVTIITGPTGCGKSSQVPQMLLSLPSCFPRRPRIEITITCPTRVSATSLARFVGSQFTNRSRVGFQIGGTYRPGTQITFATVGVLQERLLREKRFRKRIRQNVLEIVIVDEVHERTVEVDTVLYLLRRKLRIERRRAEKLKVLAGRGRRRRKARNSQQPTSLFRVVLMSATADTGPLQAYFEERSDKLVREEEEEEGEMLKEIPLRVPILDVPDRLFDVKVAYLDELFGWINMSEDSPQWQTILKRIKKTLPTPKGVLVGPKRYVRPNVFDMISTMASRLIAALHNSQSTDRSILIFLPGIAEILNFEKRLLEDLRRASNFKIHIMHSCIPMEEQTKALQMPDGGVRKIVLATNIAESSITIPDIHFVIDFCLNKLLDMNNRSGSEALLMEWGAKENLDQRKGRAGRVQNGVCFRMILNNCWDALPPYIDPEMLRLSLSSLVLKLIKMQIGVSVEDTLKKFVTSPKLDNIRRAYCELEELGAIQLSPKNVNQLTPFGLLAADLPVSLCGSKLIFLGVAFGYVHECILLAALMDAQGIFYSNPTNFLHTLRSMYRFGEGTDSDVFANLFAFVEWRNRQRDRIGFRFCYGNSIYRKKVLEVEAKLRMIYDRMSNKRGKTLSLCPPDQNLQMLRTSEEHLLILRILVGAAYQRNLVRMVGSRGRRLPEDFDPERSGFLQMPRGEEFGEMFEEKTRDFIEGIEGGLGKVEKIRIDGRRVYVEFLDECAGEGGEEEDASSSSSDDVPAIFLAQRFSRRDFDRMRVPPDCPYQEMPYAHFNLEKRLLLSPCFFSTPRLSIGRDSILSQQFPTHAVPSSFDFVFGTRFGDAESASYVSMCMLLPPGLVDILVMAFASKLRRAPEVAPGFWEVVHNGMPVYFRPKVNFAARDRIASLKEMLSSFSPSRMSDQSLQEFQDHARSDLQALVRFANVKPPEIVRMEYRYDRGTIGAETVVLRKLFRTIVSYIPNLRLRVRVSLIAILRSHILIRSCRSFDMVRLMRPGDSISFHLMSESRLRFEMCSTPARTKLDCRERIKRMLRFHFRAIQREFHSVEIVEDKNMLYFRPKRTWIGVVMYAVFEDKAVSVLCEAKKGGKAVLIRELDSTETPETASFRTVVNEVFCTIDDIPPEEAILRAKDFYASDCPSFPCVGGPGYTICFCPIPPLDEFPEYVWRSIDFSASSLIVESPSDYSLLDHFRLPFQENALAYLRTHRQNTDVLAVKAILTRIVEFYWCEEECSLPELKSVLFAVRDWLSFMIRVQHPEIETDPRQAYHVFHSLVFPPAASCVYLFDGVVSTFEEVGRWILDLVVESIDVEPLRIRILKVERSLDSLRQFFSRLALLNDRWEEIDVCFVLKETGRFVNVSICRKGVEKMLLPEPPPEPQIGPPKRKMSKKKRRRWELTQQQRRATYEKWQGSFLMFCPPWQQRHRHRRCIEDRRPVSPVSLIQRILSYVPRSCWGIARQVFARKVFTLELVVSRIVLSFCRIDEIAKKDCLTVVASEEGIWRFEDCLVHETDFVTACLCAVRAMLRSRVRVLHFLCFFNRLSYFEEILHPLLRVLGSTLLVAVRGRFSLKYARLSVVNALHSDFGSFDSYLEAIDPTDPEEYGRENDFLYDQPVSFVDEFDFPCLTTISEAFPSRQTRRADIGASESRVRRRNRQKRRTVVDPIEAPSTRELRARRREKLRLERESRLRLCELCNAKCYDELTYQSHINGKRHRKKVGAQSSIEDGESVERLFCEICQIWCPNKFSFDQHVGGRKHAKKVVKVGRRKKKKRRARRKQ